MQAEDNASKGKLRLAVEEYKAALALDPDHSAHNVHLHLGLCKVLVRLGRGKDAVTSCTEVLEIDGDLVEALVQVCAFALSYCNIFGKKSSYSMNDTGSCVCLTIWYV